MKRIGLEMKNDNQFLLDTNVIIRYLVKDHIEHFQQASIWFNQAKAGKIKMIIVPIVVAECCYVLESFYEVSRESIAQKMQVLLGQRWIQVENRKEINNLWQYYLKGLHFVDSYLLSSSSINQTKPLSFDKAVSPKEIG